MITILKSLVWSIIAYIIFMAIFEFGFNIELNKFDGYILFLILLNSFMNDYRIKELEEKLKTQRQKVAK